MRQALGGSVLALSVLAAPACPPPPVTPPAGPSLLRVQVTCAGRPASGARVEVQGLATMTADDTGTIVATVPPTLALSHLFVAAAGCKPFDRHLDLPMTQPLVVALERDFVPLPRLVRYRQFFRLETGVPFTVIEASDFNLLNRWQHGEDVEPVLAQRAGLGFNMLRVWTLYNLPATRPSDEGIGVFLDLDYARVGDFLDLCARHGLYVELTAYTSTERPEHWPQLVAAIRGKTNVLLELVNEADDPRNHLVGTYARPAGVLASHGSGSADARPPDPFWDWAGYHTNGLPEEQRKVGHNAMELSDGPVLTNETSRYPDVGMWAGATLERQKRLAFDAAAGAALLAAGSCFHSAAGKSSRLWTVDEAAVAGEWARGARSVDLACQDGLYVHRQELETADLIRAYERRGVSGRPCTVKIRK